MILDEPTAFLDVPRRAEIMQMLRRLAHTLDRAVLLSTHDLDLALRCADRLWLMRDDGRIEVGAPEDLVLSGAFQAAFDETGMRFDAATGAFSIPGEVKGRVRLLGHGTRLEWTRRALERADYRIDPNAADEITVMNDRWRGKLDGLVYEWRSLAEVVDGLRNAIGTPYLESV